MRHHPLFSACSETLLADAVEGSSLRTFPSGTELKGYGEMPFLCIIRRGSAHVYTQEQCSDLLLRILREGDTFGVATLFGNAGTSAITKIMAVSDTEALCMKAETVRHLITGDGNFALRYIDFLADRIRFLNKRIACIGAGSAEDKLCTWLLNQTPDIQGDITLTLPMSLSRLADTLGLGRASLYRALDELASRGLLIRQGKTLLIPSRASLKAFGKSERT